MKSVDRLTRVNELLKREIAEYLERHPLPGTDGVLVSVTTVNCSVDLRNATVGISVFGGRKHTGSDVLEQLRNIRVELQSRIARDLKFKHTPVLLFKLDERLAMGDRVLEILEQGAEEATDGQPD